MVLHISKALVVLTMAGIALTCSAQAERDSRRARKSKDPRFDPGVVKVESDSPIAQSRELLASSQAEQAYNLAAKAISKKATKTDLPRLQWIAARAAEELDRAQDAQRAWSALSQQVHPLSRWATLFHARSLLAEHPVQALKLVGALAQARWPGRRNAQVVEIQAMLRCGKALEGIEKALNLLDKTASHVAGASFAMPTADALVAQGDEDALLKALAVYRRIATRAPASAVGKEAAEKEASVIAALPAGTRATVQLRPYQDELARGQAYRNSLDFTHAAEVFSELSKRDDLNAEQRCQARYKHARVLIAQRKRKEGGPLMEAIAGDCHATHVVARALYHAARAHAAFDEHDQAIALYGQLERRAAAHRLADDALYRSALHAGLKGDLKEKQRRLRLVAKRYPHGDMQHDALFALAWQARGQKAYRKALRYFDQAIERRPKEDQEGLRGRTAYWRARTLADMGKRKQAIAAYEEIVNRWVLNYHGQQALQRLLELAPSRAKRLLSKIKTDQAPRGERIRFARRPEMTTHGFQTALELLIVGEHSLAEQELTHLGALGEGADRDMLWLVASLYDQAQAYSLSTRLVRKRLPSFRQHRPVGAARAHWQLAYPFAFAGQLDAIAKAQEVPSSFVRAVAREESSFNPRAVSAAKAYGLIQVISSTARRYAEGTGHPTDPESLKKASINLEIGTRFVRALRALYADNPAVVPAAYNAGQGAVNRWLHERPNQPLDEWIENIPYAETKRYTRRVLQSYGIYSWLYDQELPPLPSKLPSKQLTTKPAS